MSARLGVFLTWAALLGCFHLLYRGFFPNEIGRLGHDFAYFLPAYLDGYVWFAKNGLLEVPWFTPSFCAGLPFYADPQSGYYSLPQWLTFVVDPVTASYLTLLVFASIGYFGMVRLCRTVFGLRSSLSLLAAGLYFLNGFLPHRMIVGENSFHAVTLVPWVAYWLLRPTATGLHSIGNGVLAGLAGAYAVHSGMNILIIPAASSVVAVMLVDGLSRPWRSERGIRAAVALAVCLAVSASKLVAGVAFIGNVPRVDYARPGFSSLLDVFRAAALATFAPSETTARMAGKWLTNVQWTVLPHEWAYQFSAAPLLAGLLAVLFFRAARAPRSSAARAQRLVAVVSLCLLLMVPLAFLYSPLLNRFYRQLPVIGASPWPMRWLVLYGPLLPLATALSLRRSLASRPRLVAAVSAVTLALTLALSFAEPREYYRQQPYDPGPVLSAHQRWTAGAALDHAIHSVDAFVRTSRRAGLPLDRNDSFLIGVSPILCYNPIFGYRLERLSTAGLAVGPVLSGDGDRLNFKNPTCYLYPRENGCRPGDLFRTDQIQSLQALADYRPIPFARSALQIAAGWTTSVVLAASGAFLVVWTLVALYRRWEKRS